MQNVLRFSLLAALVVLMASCDPLSTWKLNMTNNSSQPVEVQVFSAYNNRADTFHLATGETVKVFETQEVGSDSDPYKCSSELSNILVFTATDTATVDYLDTQLWQTDTKQKGKVFVGYRHSIEVEITDDQF